MGPPMSKKSRPHQGTSDFGTRERLQHTEGIAYENTDKRLGSPKRMRVTTQTPLDRYYAREQITRRQFEAGQQLYAIWRRAGRAQRLTANYDANIVDGGKNDAESGADAFTEYLSILREIGRDLAGIAQWVCVQGSSANEWAKNNGHDPKGGIVALRLTLDALGDVFKMPRD